MVGSSLNHTPRAHVDNGLISFGVEALVLKVTTSIKQFGMKTTIGNTEIMPYSKSRSD